ncbi:MAG TPA: choice-of-anchor Q domain-containing protein [Anaerolineales bacterium]|nr:choice-of-anchor Q domain-containing protein [Anaerolineales bacterium]
MTLTRKFTQAFLAFTMILSTILSLSQPQAAVSAQKDDGIHRDYNAESGKVTRITGTNNEPISLMSAMSADLTAQERSEVLVEQFAPEFGLTQPSQELQLAKESQPEPDRVVTKYQQVYQGVPVLGGELIVNASQAGELYSMNGEVAQGLDLNTQPDLSKEAAISAAQHGMVKWYGGAETDYQQTEASLWIFDESLLHPSLVPAMLVWKVEMVPLQAAEPVRELVLVDAHTGNIPLHFNQIDTAWENAKSEPSQPLQDDAPPTATPTEVPTEATENAIPTERVLPSITATPLPTEQPQATTLPLDSSNEGDVTAAAATWYVAPTGSDSNLCYASNSPCRTLNGAITKAGTGDVIKVTTGTYTNPASNVAVINKGLTLSGGWDSAFAIQGGASIIDGGGVQNGILANSAGSTVVVENFVIQNSHTGSDSGGIYIYGANFTLKNSSVINNTAGRGAGIFLINNASLSLINTTIASNVSNSGAGIYVSGPSTGTVNIKYSTIAYNSASVSGGGVSLPTTGTTITNSIVANNTSPSNPDCSGTINTSNYNIIGNITGCTVTAGSADQLGVNPQISSTLINTPPVYTLLGGSPAIDKGNSGECPATDELGTARPQSAGCDIGAFELEVFDPGVPFSVTVSGGNNQKKQTGQSFNNPLTVLVTDYFGTPVAGASVTFIAPTSGASGTFASNNSNTETVTTDANGLGNSSIFTANSLTGAYTVSVSTSQTIAHTTFFLENLPPPGIPASFSLAGGNNQQKPINQAYDTRLSVSILDSYNNPVPSGINVTFTAPASGASGIFAGSNSRTETVTTNASGIAAASVFTANGTTGNFNVGVSVQGITTTANFSLRNLYTPGVATSITSVSGGNQLKPVNQAFPNPLVVLVKDGNGDPVNGATVTFTAPASGPSGTFASNGSRTENVLTNASGNATSSVFTANATGGTYTVQATTTGVGNAASFWFENQYVRGVPTTITVLNGNSQQAFPNHAFLIPLTVRVTDGYGSSISGINVTFTAPGSGASGTFAASHTNATTITTDSSGSAISSVFTANDEVGTYNINVSAAGYGFTTSLSLANIWGDFYVAPGGLDTNACNSPAAPCLTINGAIGKATAGKTIMVATGVYTSAASQVVLIDKNITISGGWDPSFTAQADKSIIDGQNARQGIKINSGVTAFIDHFLVKNGQSASAGGGIDALGNLTLTESIVTANISSNSTSGGGIYSNASLLINNSLISYNTSGWAGGGIDVGPSGTLSLNNSTVLGNKIGARGAGIYQEGGTVTISNSTISENNTGLGYISEGGGLYQAGGILTINNTTFTKNGASWGGSLFKYAGTTTIRNSILFNNVAQNCYGTINTSDHNLITKDGYCSISQSTGDLYNVDPRLSAYMWNVPGYYPILPGSPAIDAGNPATCLPNDQRRLPRPQGSVCDLGAYEYPTSTGTIQSLGIMSGSDQQVGPGLALPLPFSVYVLDNNGSPMPGMNVVFTAPASGPSGTFSGATNTITIPTNDNGIATAPAFTANTQLGGYTVVATVGSFPNSLNFNVTNIAWYVSPAGDDSNTCDSPLAPCKTINAGINKALAGGILYLAEGVYTGNPGSNVATISKNIDIVGGWNSDFTSQSGASIIDGQNQLNGIRVTSGTVNLDRISVRNTFSGIWNSGTLTIRNSTIQHNRATDGAGILNDTGANLSVFNSTLDNNVSASSGGAIYHRGSQLTIVNSTISNNMAGSAGGIYLTGGAASLLNVTITQNIATSASGSTGGGGIYIGNNVNLSLANSIIAGNSAAEGQDCYGSIQTSRNNLIGTGSDCSFVSSTNDQIGSSSKVVAAQLGNLADNGGLTYTHALQEGSAAIDEGASCPDTDQRGVARSTTICDIGAFEGSLSHGALPDIRTYTANHTEALFGRLVCDQITSPCASNIPDANKAQLFAVGVYNLYLSKHNRNGIGDNNMPILSTVQYKTGYKDAFWNGAQMIYGDGYGFVSADDIVAHELTHGVTEVESGLFYYEQSGAINESLSDLWGEYYDQTNGLGNDAATVRWLIGENITGKGAVRSMSSPPAYGDPDKMTSSLYVKTEDDNWGIHSNSGVNNKAVYLMVAGGTFNGRTVKALGWDKTAAIYYEAQTNLLTPGSDYSDLYYDLQQACTNLAGQKGITASDCTEVQNALDAVQMNTQPVFYPAVSTQVCPSGTTTTAPAALFDEDFESGTNNWNIQGAWSLWSDPSYGHWMWGNDQATLNNSTLTMKNGIYIPEGGTPYLFFYHAFAFEYYKTYYYDGAVLEYSKDGGITWLDAKPLFSAGQNYKGTILTYFGNALKGRSAFVGDSHGWVYSRYNLQSLAGQTVKFRWHFATDDEYNYGGWYVDDIHIYRCAGTPSLPTLEAPANNGLTTDYTPLLNWSDSGARLDHYQIQVATTSNFLAPIYDREVTTSEFTIPSNLPSDSKYYWRVRSFSTLGATLGWTTPFSFRTALVPTTLAAPADANPELTLHPSFEWGDVPNATGYTLQISKNSAFTLLALTAQTTASNYTPTGNLPANMPLYWRVFTKGANGPSAPSVVRSFTSPNPPSVPVLVSPTNNALNTNYLLPRLDWNPSTLPTGVTFDHYQLQVARDTNFTDLVLDHPESDRLHSEYIPSNISLDSNSKYSWRVQSFNTLGQYNTSATWTLRAATLPPVLSTPTDGESLLNKRPTLEWNAVVGASGYTIIISRYANLSSPLRSALVTSSTYALPIDLPANTKLYWHVQATGVNGPSLWSPTWSFTTGNPPGVPALLAPANNALVFLTQPKLDWSNAVLPAGTFLDHYEVQLATDLAFTSNLLTQSTATSDFAPVLNPNTKYYWHVRAISATGQSSAWSATWSFREAILPPTLLSPGNGETAISLRPSFDWEDAQKATGYTIQISLSSTFGTLLVNSNVSGSTYLPAVNLPAHKTLYWRVRANGPNGPSAWITFHFATP